MAAKGRSPSMPSAKGSNTTISGTTTPASNSIPDSTPASSWADDAETNGVTNVSSSKSQDDLDVASPVRENTEAESADPISHGSSTTEKPPHGDGDVNTENVEKASTEPETAATMVEGESTTKESESTEQDSTAGATEEGGKKKKKAAPKPVYHEAKPPPVNPWLQRAADAKAKAAVPSTSSAASSGPTSDADRSRVDPRRKSEQPLNKDARKADPRPTNNRPRRDSRTDEAARKQALPKRERAQSEAGPAVGNETSWPKPTDALDDDKKKGQDKEDRSEKAAASAAAKGRPEWKAMPYTPTAVFETQITGRGAGRMGKGVVRGGLTGSGRGATSPPGGVDNQRASPRASSMPNGEQAPADKIGDVKTDRDAMPPPTKAGRAVSDGPKDAKTEGGKTLTPITTDMARAAEAKAAVMPNDASARQASTPRTNKSPRKDAFPKRNGSVHEGRSSFIPNGDDAAADGVNGTDGATSKSAFAERQNQPFDGSVPAFRESKRGRGKGRGGFNNGPFNGQQFDYQAGGFAMNPSFSPRGAHFQRGGRNNYSHHQAARSQSMAVDQFGRAIPYGYPMMQMTPDFYGPYSAGPYGFPPQTERDFLVGQVSLQVEYYFSIDNLIKDLFLRKHMDSHGWIFLSIVADFNRLKTLTTDYDVIKQACLQSQEIEIRVGEDGKDRVRRVEGWNNFVLKMEDRDASAQAEPPTTLRRPSAPRAPSYEQQMFYPASPVSAQPHGAYPRMDRQFQMMNGGPPPFMPEGMNRFNEFVPQEESRGRQPKASHRDMNGASMTNGHAESTEASGEHDNFPTSSIDGLTVVVRKHDLRGAPFHNANTRTFSDGSIDSRNIMEEVTKSQEPAPQTNGVGHSNRYADQEYRL